MRPPAARLLVATVLIAFLTGLAACGGTTVITITATPEALPSAPASSVAASPTASATPAPAPISSESPSLSATTSRS